VAETLARKGMENETGREGTYRFMTTGERSLPHHRGAFLQLRSTRSSTSARRSRRLQRDRAWADRPATRPSRDRPGFTGACGESATPTRENARFSARRRSAGVPVDVGAWGRMDHGRVLAAAASTGRRISRRRRRPPERTDGRDPAADRACRPCSRKLRGARGTL
jgi:hypothetical protein